MMDRWWLPWAIALGIIAALFAWVFIGMRAAEAHGYRHYAYRRHRAAAVASVPPTEIPDPSLKVAPTEPFVGWGRQHGWSSYYGKGDGFAGRQTACGIRFIPSAMVVASPTLPCWSMIQVCTVQTHKCVIATVIDRGPAARMHRVMDASPAVAERLGFLRAGLSEVDIQVLSPGKP